MDILCRKLGTTPYGVRRSLAMWLRFRSLECGATPAGDELAMKKFEVFKRKVTNHFGWSESSLMWEETYSVDCLKYINHKFYVHPDIQWWFTV